MRRLTAFLLYALLLVPAGLLLRLARDPLDTRRAPRTTNWRAVRPREPSLERARRPG